MKLNGSANYIFGSVWSKARYPFIRNKVDRKRHKFTYDSEFIEDSKSHPYIRELLSSPNPAMIARWGITEATIVGLKLLREENGLIKPKGYGKYQDMLYNTAGFFSENGERRASDIDRYVELMKLDGEQADFLGVHYGFLEDYVINSCCKNAALTEFDNLRLMAFEDSWGRALEGKKVLVISPFVESIKKQYERIDLVWGEHHFLPKFELITYKAIQTIAGNNTEKYKDWFEALQIMKDDISKIDFDVAIIGCGAYGFGLAAECKRLGKKSIHLGGQTQMCFGVIGQRWEEIPFYNQFINEHWIHPSGDEIPNNFKKVEGGCYW